VGERPLAEEVPRERGLVRHDLVPELLVVGEPPDEIEDDALVASSGAPHAERHGRHDTPSRAGEPSRLTARARAELPALDGALRREERRSVFKKILIANRGEIACRIERTLRRLGVASVAVHSDADANALHVEHADEAVRIGPAPVKESYLCIDAILDAAKKTGAEAIHPGYGLLSEKEEFARAVRGAGLVYIGPPERALAAFGDKIKAREVARTAGVSPPPGTNGPVAPEDAAAIAAEAERIGFPILVKAAGGGGGIGMQIVETADKLARAVQACSDRGKSAFADARVYMERYVRSPRHIEVQVLCDTHGHAVALGERECSMQRRHQKIIEETPSAAPFFQGADGEARRQKLWADAVRIVREVGYEGAGTVEFVASPDGELFFLEVNARLQVEHCVTEMVTGIDLVEQQIRVALGEELAPEVLAPKRSGHSIEARVYAEDPAKKFAPQPGHIATLRWPDGSADLRIETGVKEGGDVTPFYDPMIAKVVAHAATRAQCIARLGAALAGTSLELTGPQGNRAGTNLAFLRALLQTPEFDAAVYDTTFAEAFAKRAS
jgi:acetyl-CoA carboxylase biotin carboxylase subunit/3-methylcrotonyl-CoA carboxylase alpha subunit